MNDMAKPTWLFWVMGLFFLAWNIFGCAGYLMHTLPSDAAYAETWGEAMAAVRHKYPAWSMAAYAIAVWGGLLAAILLLLRKNLSVTLFTLSLIAAVISFIWGLTNAEAKAASGDGAWIMPVLVAALGLFEIWWARRARAQNVIS